MPEASWVSSCQRGEHISAMSFASDALMLFPNERKYRDLADEIALAAPDPLSTVPVQRAPGTSPLRQRGLAS